MRSHVSSYMGRRIEVPRPRCARATLWASLAVPHDARVQVWAAGGVRLARGCNCGRAKRPRRACEPPILALSCQNPPILAFSCHSRHPYLRSRAKRGPRAAHTCVLVPESAHTCIPDHALPNYRGHQKLPYRVYFLHSTKIHPIGNDCNRAPTNCTSGVLAP